MKKLILLALLVCPLFATTVTGPLKTPSTTAPFSGTIVITPSSQWTNVSSQVVSRTPITVIVTAGSFSVSLEPTDTATNPTNPYYTFQFYPSGQKSYALRYSVPTSGSPLTIAQLPLLSVVPDPTYNFVTTNRAVTVTAPLTGGGALYTDLTISCPTCAITTGTPAQNDCAKFDASGHLVSAGAPCGSGGGGGGGDALTTNPLSQFASTTSAQLRSTLSDETGTGSAVFATGPTISAPTISGHPVIEGVTSTGATGSGNLVFHNNPTFVAPVLGAATATSINGTSIPSSGTLARTDVGNTFTGHQTIEGVTSTGATGTGNIVYHNAPTFIAPILGAATATSINGTVIPSSAALARTDVGNTFTGHQTVEGVTSTGATGTGNLVFHNAPTFIAPILGSATATSINGTTIPSSGALARTDVGNTFTGHQVLEGVTSTGATGTGKLVFDNAPTITGHPTIEGVTSTGATGTGNHVFSVAPTITGHPTIEGVTSTGATGTGNHVYSISPTLTGTLAAAAANFSGAVSVTDTLDITGTGPMELEWGDENGLKAANGGNTVTWVGATGRTTSLKLQQPTSDPSGNARVPIWGTPVGGVAPFSGWANLASRTGANTYSGSGLQDYSQVPTRPFQSDVIANLPATCSVGQFFYATDTGRPYTCTATNTWQANIVARNGANAYAGTGLQDFSQVPTRPYQSAAIASIPATCSVGQKFYATDTGRDYTCTATDTWQASNEPDAPGTGVHVRTGVNTAVNRSIVGAGILSLANGNGVSGNPTISLGQTCADTGTTANAIACTVTLGGTLADGTLMALIPGAASTSAVTISINAGAATPMTYQDGSALVSGELAAGIRYVIAWDATATRWRLANRRAVPHPGSAGLVAVTGAATAGARQIVVGGRLSIADGNAVSGNPTVAFAEACVDTSASANAITCAPTLGGALADGTSLALKPAVTNTGATTASLNGGTAVPITLQDGTALSGGELVAGRYYHIIWDSGNSRWRLQTSSLGGAASFAALTGSTNSTAAMVCTTGCSITPSGSGVITTNKLASGTSPTTDGVVSIDTALHVPKFGSNGSTKTFMATDTAVAKAQTPLTTKGDLWVTDGTNMHRLGVGADGTVLTADAASTDGVKWNAAAGGGDASTNTSTSVDSEVAVFSGTAGKTIKRATGTGFAQLTSGVLSVKTNPEVWASMLPTPALCDGSTDDSAAFNSVSAGTTVKIPAGATCMVSNLTLNNRVTLSGGAGTILKKVAGSTTTYMGNITGTDITLENIKFDGASVVKGSGNLFYWFISGATNFVMRNCQMINTGSPSNTMGGILIYDSTATIDGVRMTDSTVTGVQIKVDQPSTNKKIRIVNNVLVGSQANAIYITDSAGSYTPYAGTQDTEVAGNYISSVTDGFSGTGQTGNAIVLFQADTVNVHDNYINDVRFAGVRVNSSFGNRIHGNHIKAAKESSGYAEFGAAGNMFLNNVISDCVSGINLTNVSTGSTNRAGFSYDTTNTAAYNKISNCTDYAIKGEHDDIYGNEIDGTAFGIWVGYGSTSHDNRVFDNAVTWNNTAYPKPACGICIDKDITGTNRVGRNSFSGGTVTPVVFPISAPSGATISAITKANPMVVTYSNTPTVTPATGQVWHFGAIGGMVELNGQDCTITATGAGTFTCGAINSTAYTTFSAPSGGPSAHAILLYSSGTTAQYSNPATLQWDDDLAVTAAANFTSGNLVKAAASSKATSDSGIAAANVVTAASNYTSGAVVISGGANKTTASSSLTASAVKSASGVLSAAAYTDLVSLWASGSCSGYLKNDGTCATPGGSGTVTVVSSGSLASTALVTGGGTTTLQTPSATATLDSSGNISTPGGISTGAGGSAAGYVQLGQGTTPSLGTTAITLTAPTSGVTSYKYVFPATSQTGFLYGTDSSNTNTMSVVGSTGTGNVVLAGGPTITGHPTVEGVTSTGATGTGKFVFDGSPTLTSLALTNLIAATAIAAPSTPSAGVGRIYVDSTSKNIAVKNDAGVVKHGVQTATCTNQAATAISDAGGVTCTTLTSAYVNTSIAQTGVDINTSHQVTATHLSSALPVNQGGTALTSGTSGGILGYTASGTIASSAALAANAVVLGGGAGATPTSSSLTATVVKAASGVLSAATAGTDYVSPSSTETLTNKTLDAEGTGNTITMPLKVWLPAAGCQGSTAGSFWDLPASTPAVAACVTGTNTQKGVLQYADTTGGFSAQNTLILPADFTGAIDARIIWRTSATTGNAKWSLSTICTDVAASATDDPAFNTASTVTTAAPGTTLRIQSSSITGVTATGCSAGNLLHVKLFRDGNDGSDTISASADFIGLELTIRRAM